MGRYTPGSETFTPNGHLIIEGDPNKDTGLLKAGETVVKGQLVEFTGGKFVAALGTDVNAVYGIASESATATGSDLDFVVFTSGTFAQPLITFPAGKTYTDYKAALRNKGIVLR